MYRNRIPLYPGIKYKQDKPKNAPLKDKYHQPRFVFVYRLNKSGYSQNRTWTAPQTLTLKKNNIM